MSQLRAAANRRAEVRDCGSYRSGICILRIASSSGVEEQHRGLTGVLAGATPHSLAAFAAHAVAQAECGGQAQGRPEKVETSLKPLPVIDGSPAQQKSKLSSCCV